VLTTITAAADGSVWALDDEHGLQRLDDSQPVPNPPHLRITSIAATSATHLWALMTDGDTQIWDGESWREGCKPAPAERLAAASDGTCWSTYYAAVSECIMEMWSSVPSGTGIRQLAVAAADTIYALGYEDGSLYRWIDYWEQIDTTPMADLSASADGLVCGLDTDGRLCLYLGGQVGWAQTHFTGLAHIAAGGVNCVWGIDAGGKAANLTAHGPFITRPTR
jgi:hypothetical protein